MPVRRGTWLIDETSFPKYGTPSVAVARQYCGALGKIAPCQVAVSTAVLTNTLAWPTSLELDLPPQWAQDADRRARAGIPRSVRFREKWRIALTHIRQVRAAGLPIEAILADAAYGNVQAFRTAVDRMGLRYAGGVAMRLAVRAPGARRPHQIGGSSRGARRPRGAASAGRRGPQARWPPGSSRSAGAPPPAARRAGSYARARS